MRQPLFPFFEAFHSDFQIDAFIVTQSGGTVYGAYKQACRESIKRIQCIAEELRNLFETNEILRHDLHQETHYGGDFSRERTPHGLAQSIRHLELVDLCRELIRFLAHVVLLRQKLGSLNRAKRHRLEIETWEHRTRVALARDLLQDGRFSSYAIELVRSLPPEFRADLLEIVRNPKIHQQLIEWYFTSHPSYPAVEPLLESLTGISEGQRIRILCSLWSRLEQEQSYVDSAHPSKKNTHLFVLTEM